LKASIRISSRYFSGCCSRPACTLLQKSSDSPDSLRRWPPRCQFRASSVWYRWALKYGTIGFITSAALLPLVSGSCDSTSSPQTNPRSASRFSSACLPLSCCSGLPLGIAVPPAYAWGPTSFSRLASFKTPRADALYCSWRSICPG
jgi:hypothetical protein